jgi:hypothetical protein
VLRDLGGAERGAGRLDHDAQAVGEGHAPLGAHGGGHGVHAGLDELDLALGGDEGDHDLGHHGVAVAPRQHRGLEDGAGLHVVDLGHGDAETDAAQAQHGVVFAQRLDAGLTSESGRERCSARSRRPWRSEGRNSWSGGSKRRMQTGLPP